jgi:glycosyltransferase involved in cell wall biosynthesis
MRLLLVTFDPPENVGGIEGRSRAYVDELTKRGHSVQLVSLSPVYDSLVQRPPDFKSVRFNSSVFRLPSAIIATLGILRRGSFQSVLLVSGSLTMYGVSLLVICRALQIRSVAFLYGRDILSAQGSVVRFSLLICTLSLADKLAVNSDFTRRILPKGSPKSVLIRPAVDSEMLAVARVTARSERTRRILFVGRLVERKGADVLINAFAELLVRQPDAKLDIVGDGPQMPPLQSLAEHLGLGDRIKFHGVLTGARLYNQFALSEVLAMPSRSSSDDVEGFGTVFLEAGIFGKPVVGTRTGGIPEAVLDEVTGLLVPDGDSHALAEALQRILSDEELRTRMGRNGRERVESQFTLGEAVNAIEQALRA